MTSIYFLYDPRDSSKLPWYVGKGLQNRAKSHWKAFLNRNWATNRLLRYWFEKLKAEGVKPAWRFLEENVENWQEAEKTWIAGCRVINPNLCNIADGGNEGPRWASSLGGKIAHLEKLPDGRSKLAVRTGILGGRKRIELYGNPATIEGCSKGGIQGQKTMAANPEKYKPLLSAGGKIGAYKQPREVRVRNGQRGGGALGRHSRWHASRGLKNSSCIFCQEAV